MLHLSAETESLAQAVAAAQRLPVDIAVKKALEAQAVALPASPSGRRRMTRERMLAFVEEMARLPILDPRPASEIFDDINP